MKTPIAVDLARSKVGALDSSRTERQPDTFALRRVMAGVGLAIGLLGAAPPTQAHPHVFVEGGVDFLFDAHEALSALRVTWLFDPFETLFTLSSHGLFLNRTGDLDESDRQKLIRRLSEWPEGFNGSAHLSIDGAPVDLALPSDLDARLMDGQLMMTFTRALRSPAPMRARVAEVGFYEATYFYAFSVTRPPKLLGMDWRCWAYVDPFDPDTQLAELQATLLSLHHEETPDIKDVGALFADRIVVRCE